VLSILAHHEKRW